jgi:hypothetical protein
VSKPSKFSILVAKYEESDLTLSLRPFHSWTETEFLALVSVGSGCDAKQPVDETNPALCAWFFQNAVTAPDHAHHFETFDRR